MAKMLTMSASAFALVIMMAQPSGAIPARVQLHDAAKATAAPIQKVHYDDDDDYGYRPYYYGYHRSYHHTYSYRGPYYYYRPYFYHRGADWCRAWLHECAKRWGWGGRHYHRCLWKHDC